MKKISFNDTWRNVLLPLKFCGFLGVLEMYDVNLDI